MLQNYSRYRILQEFFDFPRKEFHIRELSRKVKLAQISITNHINHLLKEGLIIKETKGIYPSYKANREKNEFKILKKQNIILNISEIGIIDEIDQKIKPNCIVLFGSASRGEDTENSDIDLFIQAEEGKIDVKKYEKKLNRKVNFIFEPDIKILSKELLNNIINGEILYGYLRVY